MTKMSITVLTKPYWGRGILPLVLCFFLTPFFLGGCGESASSKKLIVATSSDNPPYEFFSSEENKVVGFDMDLAEKIATLLGYTLEISDMDFNGIIPALHAGRAHMGMAAFTPSNERKKSVALSDIYLEVQAAMVIRKTDDIQDSQDFRGKKIGVQLGSTHEAFLKDIYTQSSHFEIVSRAKLGELIQELANHRLDVVVMESGPAMAYAKNHSDFQAKVIPNSVVTFSIVLPKDSPHIAKINEALKTLKTNGTLQELKKKWLETH